MSQVAGSIFRGGGGFVEIPGGSKKKDSLPMLGLQEVGISAKGSCFFIVSGLVKTKPRTPNPLTAKA